MLTVGRITWESAWKVSVCNATGRSIMRNRTLRSAKCAVGVVCLGSLVSVLLWLDGPYKREKAMRRRKKNFNKGEEYIRSCPELGRWIKQCVQCQVRGYDPNMPDEVGFVSSYWKAKGWKNTHTARYIRKYFKSLALDDCGLCEVCSRN
jgi:hypothetical protein